MKQHFIIQQGHRHLLLFFAGWGMDETPFTSIHPIGCDWMIAYDYRSLSFNDALLQPYTDITLVAWSMGVWAASHIRAHYPHLPIRTCTAINGTPFPIHETKGIDPLLFEGTLKNLSRASLQKFQRRMCHSATAYKEFLHIAPQRGVEELREELAAIGRQANLLLPVLMQWDRAVIGQNDRIFLPDHQLAAWEKQAVSVTRVDAAHYEATLFEKELQNPVLKEKQP
ncbi:Dithiobiotin synthetase [gut metagenome]|uniref:Dithiobiotin synthetase n=1 Tax=gut metagenome TaxID=749906 RepID=J9BX80_9ZZZZ